MKTRRMKLVVLGAVMALAAPTAAWAADTNTSYGKSDEPKSSSGSKSGSETTSKSAKESGTGSTSSESAGGKQLSQDLQEGLQKLHAANQAEIQGGQLAEQSAASAQVKAFGRQMVSDHTKNDEHLQTMARSMGVSLEGKAFEDAQKDAQDAMKDVQGKTGAEFDEAYSKLMVKDHQKDAKDVKSLAQKAKDDKQPQVAAFLGTTEKAMQGHLSHAKMLEQTAKKEAKAASKSGSSTGTGSAGSSK